MSAPEPTKIASRLAEVKERIFAAAGRGGRSPVVTIVAVTKGHPVESCRAALAAGLHELGENRVVELAKKVEEVGRVPRWHLVGRLQRNKVRTAAPLFDLFHALDSVRLAEELAKESLRLGAPLPVLVQVNASGEQSKAGIVPERAVDFIGGVVEMGGLEVQGLMTMAPLTGDERVLRATFARTRRVFEEAAGQLRGFQPRHLSMGMSNDYELAVEEGSTMVRLGTILFGERGA